MHQTIALRAGPDAHQNAFGSWHRAADGMSLHISPHLLIHMLCGSAHAQLAQCSKITLAEEIGSRTRYLLRDIDFAFLKSFHQLVGRQVNQLDLRGIIDDSCRGLFRAPRRR